MALKLIKRFYGREGANLPGIEKQTALARKHGFDAVELRGATQRDGGGANVYVDHKPRRTDKDPPDYWFRELVRHPLRGGWVCVMSPHILGDSAAEIRRKCAEIGKAGGIVFDMGANDERGELVNDFASTIAFLERGQAAVGRVAMRAMAAGKRRTGNKGGRDRTFTDAELAKIEPLWLSWTGTNPGLAAKATLLIGRKISYTTIWRVATANKWGEKGSEPDTLKRGTKAKRRRMKRKRAKALDIDTMANAIVASCTGASPEVIEHTLQVIEGLEFN